MYLYGAGGHAKVIIDIIKSQGKVISGFIDDNELIDEYHGYTVTHNFSNISYPIVLSIGDNQIRKKIAEKLSNTVFEKAIHSSAIISEDTKIEAGTVVMHGSIIQAGTEIGKHCIINTGASVDHDCKISDYVHISPNATLCGNVNVGEGSWIGAGATIISGVTIGKWSIVAAGSVVIKDIPDNVLAAGVPCKIKKKSLVMI